MNTSPGLTSGIDGVRSSYDGMAMIHPADVRTRGVPAAAPIVRTEITRGFIVRPCSRRLRALLPAHSTAARALPRSSTIVAPPGLLAMCSAPISIATVRLPSTMRAMRIQVVWGNCRSAGPRTSDEIEGHQAEATGLQHQVHRLQRAIGMARFAHPQQPREIDAGGFGRHRVEAIVRIDERDDLAAGGRRRRHRQPQRRASRRTLADDLREMAAPHPAPERVVEGRPSARRHAIFVRGRPGGRRRQRDVEFPGSQEGFEFRAGRRHFRLLFASRRSIRPTVPAIKKTLAPAAYLRGINGLRLI